ncbi:MULTISPECIES: metal ABC transporter solute-binding protein, Zn/Mn family [unclassified Nitratiruptor]|uniref:metal ABC transporter substrate-binding protein n=1 Tax=unclassified Nitratiruptor TaxID=2624044 RepID=UPI001914F164|nr:MULTISPECIES: zinc ABC transporter substrate-binding protein [unclassified Nitratiruptor]BCD59293.1 zinc/manganese transport system substrate-binding protein [Nitratiruptor sp. YY08-10]BCD63217.1 zinc/manganese transport system substrate-binding protein [Nitratiruptor sp. YY08-14]
MRKIVLILLILTGVFAKIHVIATYGYLGEIVKRVGGKYVKVNVLATPKYDPHFVVPKPSLIGKLSRADMLVINGAGLEIGWLPPLLTSANNGKINPGRLGFVDASQVIELINKPKAVSRAYGDIHPQGNPHFNTDPHNMIPIAMLVASRLQKIDPLHAKEYDKNLASFLQHWKSFLQEYDAKMAPCKGLKIVQYHQLYNYFLNRYKIVSVGTIEPLPGIAPSSKHTLKLIALMKQENVTTILQDPYHEKKTASYIAAKTGARVVILPHDIGAVPGADSLENFYLLYEKRLCQR